MKKLIYLFGIAFLILQSCSTKDSNSATNSDNPLLLKKWYHFSETYQGRITYSSTCSNGNRDYIEFKSPNIFYSYYVMSSTNCNYTSEGPFTWVKSGDVINFYHNGTVTHTATITELTATTLKFVDTDAVTHNSASEVYNSF